MSWQQLGCYGPQPASAPFRYTYPVSSNDQCLRTCADHGFFYAALNGNQCVCDYVNPFLGARVDCTAVPLPAGGLTVYSIPLKLVDGWKNLGCVTDHDLLFDNITRVLTGLVDQGLTTLYSPSASGNFDAVNCVAYCASLHFKVAGIEFTTQCFCGDSFKGDSVALSKGCAACSQNFPDQMCGGGWSLSVYSKEFADLQSVPGASFAANSPQQTATATAATPSTTINAGPPAVNGGGDGGTPTIDHRNGDNGLAGSGGGGPSTAGGDISSSALVGDQGQNLPSTAPPAPTQSDGSLQSSASAQPVATATDGSTPQNVPSSGDSGNENKVGGLSQNGVPGVASQRRPLPSQSLTVTNTQQAPESNTSNSGSTGNSSGRLSNGAIAGIIAASIALVIILMIIAILLIRKRGEKEEKRVGRLALPTYIDLQDGSYDRQAGHIEHLEPAVAPSVYSEDTPTYSSWSSTENGETLNGYNGAAGLDQRPVTDAPDAPPYDNLQPPSVSYQGDRKRGKGKR